MDGTAIVDILISYCVDDKMAISFTDHRGKEASAVQFLVNATTQELTKDGEGRNITVMEMGQTYDEELVVIGNEDEGYLLRVSQVTNQTGSGSNTYSDDKVTFVDYYCCYRR